MRLAQAGDAARGRIAVGVRVGAVSTSLATMCGGRRHVGIAHAEIDDVVTGGARSVPSSRFTSANT